jgi:hypothetical protein
MAADVYVQSLLMRERGLKQSYFPNTEVLLLSLLMRERGLKR